MPWKEHRLVDLREEFVLRAKAPGSSISALCREYQISRKTAYKWLRRFDDRGVEGLRDLSRRPTGSIKAVSGEMVLRVLEAREDFPRWGPKKIRIVVGRTNPPEQLPSARTIARILARAGKQRIRRIRAQPGSVPLHPPAIVPVAPNDLWTVDFKGWWRIKSGDRCEPLTVRDAFSRKILLAKIVHSTSIPVVRKAFLRLFQQYGLPSSIHVDNGTPFVAMASLGGLTQLSAWWVALGIRFIRSRPAHPQDNGAHERMHVDLEDEAVDRNAASSRAQQGRLDAWSDEFNSLRPHEALEMKTPNEVYRKSSRQYVGVVPAIYPARFFRRKVAPNCTITFDTQTYHVGQAMTGYLVGVEPVHSQQLNVRFYNLDLGMISPTIWQKHRRRK